MHANITYTNFTTLVSNPIVYETIVRLDGRIKHHVVNLLAKELTEIGGLVPAISPKWGRQIGIRAVDEGERRFVHAPATGGTVRMDNLDTPYWQKHYVGAKRVLE